MDFTISIGTWIIPLVLTFIYHGYAQAKSPKGESNMYGGNAMVGAVNHGTALIFTLFSWLIWALAT